MQNWANHYAYRAARVVTPESPEGVAGVVAASGKVRGLGTRHSFNAIADRPGGTLVSTARLDRIERIDAAARQVTVQAGVTYARLGPALTAAGLALPNLASLPHISVAGAAATGTHGSGETLGCLSTSVAATEFVLADGSIRTVRRGDADFAGSVVHLGRLGVVTRLTLDCVPAFEVAQFVYDDVPLDALLDHLDAVVASAYSVSGFISRWDAGARQVWMKCLPGRPHFDLATIGGSPADGPRHPLLGRGDAYASGGAGLAAVTQQLGVPGPWHARLPHFRAEFVPSSGEELQTEYFVPREHAAAAVRAVGRLADAIDPVLQVSELRFVAADDLWMSPCYGRASVGLHFTWKKDAAGVRAVVPRIESALGPFAPRPHWGKLSTLAAEAEATHPMKPAFDTLCARLDPHGKFAGWNGSFV